MRIFLTDFVAAMLALAGASSAEEMVESEVQRFEQLRDHPVEINTASRSRLLATGLLSHYQIASLLDYRSRCGRILSYNELALVDGFNADFIENLKPFIRIGESSGALIRQRGNSHIVSLQSSLKDGETGAGLKYESEFGDRLEFNLCSRASPGAWDKPTIAANASYYSRSGRLKTIAGDFNARFGQGLLVWSGFSLSGFSGKSSFKRNASGMVASTSYSPMFCGIASDYSIGRNIVSAGVSLYRNKAAVANWTRVSGKSNFGLSVLAVPGKAPGVSADFSIGRASCCLYGESAFSGRGIAALTGLSATPKYGCSLNALLRYYSDNYISPFSGAARSFTKASDEIGASLGFQNSWISATFDASGKPVKGTEHYKLLLVTSKEFGKTLTFKPEARVSIRYRPGENIPFKADQRLDMKVAYGSLYAETRFNLLLYKDSSWLTFAGLGRDGERFDLSLRAIIFKVDNWDDRISCYERDVPGSFTVPAYYGRGWKLSSFLSWKSPGGRSSFYTRLSYLTFPWTIPKKDSQFEIRVFYRMRLYSSRQRK